MSAIKIKLLAAILAVIGVLAAVVIRGGRPAVVFTADDQAQQAKIEHAIHAPKLTYLVP
jgi:hypothetical protein